MSSFKGYRIRLQRVFSACIVLACTGVVRAQVADVIYQGGDIVTISGRTPSAESLAVKDGKILAVGTVTEVENAHKGASTRVINLAGKALLPGFIDAHSHHIASLTVANQVNVSSPPAGPCKDVPGIVAELVKFRDARQIPRDQILQAYGYDDTFMPGGRLLNRDDLDAAFPDQPVIVGHVSMHGGVLNSVALKRFNITTETKTPDGGVIVRKPGTNEPWGLIMETAFLPVFSALPQPTRDEEVQYARAGQRLYARNGITTAHDGATHANEIELMKRVTAAGANLIDVVAYPFILDLDAVLKTSPTTGWGTYDRHFKIGGVKITIDGSPQGKTAFFTTPYLNGGPSGEKDWRGELSFPIDTVKQMVKRVYDLNVPLNLHCNGDAAIDTFLEAYEFARNGDYSKPWNVTSIHSQFLRKDQIPRFVKYKIRPSFYTLHTFYFAEAHIANRGREQAMYISPMRDAIDAGLHPTNHTDFVVAPLDQMFMLWSAVNRISRAGAEIGPGQRVTPLEGLKAMTIWPAEQYGEEASKGSLEPGKLADLVILDKNPLTVPPMEIKDIKVVETLKEGKTIYAAGQ